MAAAQGGFWGAILGVRLLAPALLRRMSASILIVSGLVLASFGMLLLLLASTGVWGLVPGALLAGAGLASVFPTAVALFTERAGRQGARVTGAVFAMAALGGATVPWAVGAISTRFASLRLALAAPLACSLLMIVLQLRTARKLDVA
jgi:fucose permease